MADKRCTNGHFIDETWDLCPYCPPEQQEKSVKVEVEVVRPRPAREVKDEPRPRLREAPAEPFHRTIAIGTVDPGQLTAGRFVVGWLVGLNGNARGESFPIRNGRNVIGRERRSDVVINDDQASAHHADLVYRPEERRFIVMDHNSTNGTYVNEAEIEPRRDLARHDVLRIGSHRFLFVPLCDDGLYWEGEGPLK